MKRINFGNFRSHKIYDGSIRKRPKGLDNKTVLLLIDKPNALDMVTGLIDFIKSKNEVLAITGHKTNVNDDGYHTTMTSQE